MIKTDAYSNFEKTLNAIYQLAEYKNKYSATQIYEQIENIAQLYDKIYCAAYKSIIYNELLKYNWLQEGVESVRRSR